MVLHRSGSWVHLQARWYGLAAASTSLDLGHSAPNIGSRALIWSSNHLMKCASDAEPAWSSGTFRRVFRNAWHGRDALP